MERTKVKSEYKIDLTTIYKNKQEFRSDCQLVLEKIKEIIKYKGKVTTSTKNLYTVLELVINAFLIVDKINLYSSLVTQIDASDKEGKSVFAKSKSISTVFATKTAFVDDEILKCKWNFIEELLKDKDLKIYEFYLKELFKDVNHILSEKEEIILSEMSNLASELENNRSIFFFQDLDFGVVEDEDKKEVIITNQNYSKLLENKNRKFRQRAFETYNKTFGKFENTFAALLNSKLSYDINKARIRGYDSPLAMSLHNYNLKKDVIDNYLTIASENRNLYKKYNEILKSVLGFKNIYSYDLRYNPVNKSDKEYRIEDAEKIIYEAFSIYGKEYQKYLKELFDNSKIDYMPTDNKATGAFCIHNYLLGSYTFLNYQNKIGDISTLAHELGHAVHALLLRDNNHPAYADSSFLLVEIASITNEILLCEHILKNSKDIYEKYELLKNLLDVLLGNFFLVASRLEVQNKMYEAIEKGNALNADFINTINLEASKKYELNGVKVLEENKYIWMRVSHYYYLYYNYQYAIGVSLATLFASKILSGKDEEIKNYLEFLKVSGRNYPAETLAQFGADLLSKETYKPLIKYINDKLKDFEKIVDQMEMK